MVDQAAFTIRIVDDSPQVSGASSPPVRPVGNQMVPEPTAPVKQAAPTTDSQPEVAVKQVKKIVEDDGIEVGGKPGQVTPTVGHDVAPGVVIHQAGEPVPRDDVQKLSDSIEKLAQATEKQTKKGEQPVEKKENSPRSRGMWTNMRQAMGEVGRLMGVGSLVGLFQTVRTASGEFQKDRSQAQEQMSRTRRADKEKEEEPAVPPVQDEKQYKKEGPLSQVQRPKPGSGGIFNGVVKKATGALEGMAGAVPIVGRAFKWVAKVATAGVKALGEFSKAVKQMGDRFEAFSPEVATARAQIDVDNMRFNMQQAQKYGDTTARYEQALAKVERGIQDWKDTFRSGVMQVLTPILEAIGGVEEKIDLTASIQLEELKRLPKEIQNQPEVQEQIRELKKIAESTDEKIKSGEAFGELSRYFGLSAVTKRVPAGGPAPIAPGGMFGP